MSVKHDTEAHIQAGGFGIVAPGCPACDAGDEPPTQTVMRELVEQDKAFVCGICNSYVDTRFVEAHADSHVTGPCQEYLGNMQWCGEPGYQVLIPTFGKRILCVQHRKGWGSELRPSP